jgi:hypothetical protein
MPAHPSAGRRPLPIPLQPRDSMSAERRLVWMCHMAREQPRLKPLAFEALLQAQVLVWVDADAKVPVPDPSQSAEQGPAPMELSFRKTRYPDGGVADQAAAAFTDIAHFHTHVESQRAAHARHCYVPRASCDALRAMAEQHLPLEIDPGSRHRLYFTSTQVRQWLARWEAGQPRAAAPPAGRQFVLWTPHPMLLDRLGAFLAQFESVGRAWVCQLGDGLPAETTTGTNALAGSEPGTLLIDALSPEDEKRIRQALPLISEDIRLPYRELGWVAAMPRPFEDMPRQRQELLTPVYDRSMSMKPLWRRIA